MVTHDVDEAVRLASRIVIMEAGRVVQAAPPRDVLRAPANAFVDRLVGGESASFRLLRVRRVDELMVQEAGPAASETIAPEAGLDAALARMLSRGTDRLAVVDADGRRRGTLRLADVVQRG
jgi:osmoprotectant transport system ATP-binding protein